MAVALLFCGHYPGPVTQIPKLKSPSQSPQTSWSAGGRRERPWGNGLLTAGVLQLTVLRFVIVTDSEQPIKKKFKFCRLPTQSLSKRPPADQET